jgi:hypothetical protein
MYKLVYLMLVLNVEIINEMDIVRKILILLLLFFEMYCWINEDGMVLSLIAFIYLEQKKERSFLYRYG